MKKRSSDSLDQQLDQPISARSVESQDSAGFGFEDVIEQVLHDGDAVSIESKPSQEQFSFLTEPRAESVRTLSDPGVQKKESQSLRAEARLAGFGSEDDIQRVVHSRFVTPADRLAQFDRAERDAAASVFLMKSRRSVGFGARRGINLSEVSTLTPELRSPSSPPKGGPTRRTSTPTSPSLLTTLVENFDPKIRDDEEDSGVQRSSEQRVLDMMDDCQMTLKDGQKIQFHELRDNLARKGVTYLSVITISHFLGDKVSLQFEQTKERMQKKLGHSDFHILVVGFGPEKFIPSFCSTVGVQAIDIHDNAFPGNYDNQVHVTIVSDPSRFIYSIMTAYQVGKVALSNIAKSNVASDQPCSQTYSNSFRAYSRLTTPSTTGSGKQFLAWAVLDLEDEQLFLLELDTDCKY